jgi:hypothetical protein
MFYEFSTSSFCTGRSAFDIREKQEIRYPPRRAGERNKIESWSLGRIFISTELSLISCFLHLVSRVICTLYLPWTFDIGFDSVFSISYLVLSIPTPSCETHCPRPPLPTLPGVLYGAEGSG